jgi:hypothetical protein
MKVNACGVFQMFHEKGTAKTKKFSIQRASHTKNILLSHMDINHGGLKILVPQELLNAPDIVSVFQKMIELDTSL